MRITASQDNGQRDNPTHTHAHPLSAHIVVQTFFGPFDMMILLLL